MQAGSSDTGGAARTGGAQRAGGSKPRSGRDHLRIATRAMYQWLAIDRRAVSPQVQTVVWMATETQ